MPKLHQPGGGPSRVDVPMAPMIDIVFQLLIFFMLNLKIIAPEGNFNVNMPIGPPTPARPDEPQIPDIKVRLQADAAGNLAQLSLNEIRLGNDDRAFEKLGSMLLEKLGRSGPAQSKDVEIEIDADYNLNYQHTVRAISRCTGRLDSKGNVIRYVEKIKFAAPRKAQD
jgi:biopolymer transport protein ExbD